MLFSHRKGLKPVRTVVQKDSMDAQLRNGLWNALFFCYWENARPRRGIDGAYLTQGDPLAILLRRLCVNYFKEPVDSLDMRWEPTYTNMRKYFFECPWNEVYDFIEFVAKEYADESTNKAFVNTCNVVLERELSAYRFIGATITEITSEEEIAEIEQAFSISSPLKAVNAHLKTALGLMSDRKSPDHRNSIKESISAVEAICRLITGNPKATLGQAIKAIEDKVGVHPALKDAFSKLYGYTCDAQGIRHALLDEPNLDFEDAKFMLVACSAFINYLISKASKAGIKL